MPLVTSWGMFHLGASPPLTPKPISLFNKFRASLWPCTLQKIVTVEIKDTVAFVFFLFLFVFSFAYLLFLAGDTDFPLAVATRVLIQRKRLCRKEDKCAGLGRARGGGEGPWSQPASPDCSLLGVEARSGNHWTSRELAHASLNEVLPSLLAAGLRLSTDCPFSGSCVTLQCNLRVPCPHH